MNSIPKPKKKRKKSTRQLAKTKAWNAFSTYIRLRDSLETTKTNTHAKCCTCGKVYPSFGKGCLQAGHYIPGRREANLFEEHGCHAQCYNCNVNLKGNPIEYRIFMENKYGWDEMLRLESQDKTTLKRIEGDYKELEKYYKSKCKELESCQM